MTAVPARVAGVAEVVLVSPPGPDGTLDAAVLAAARVAGVTEAYRVGGAQVIAAFAYGTESVRRVDKIVGAGNVCVAAARAGCSATWHRRLAGPSEVVIVADSADPPTRPWPPPIFSPRRSTIRRAVGAGLDLGERCSM